MIIKTIYYKIKSLIIKKLLAILIENDLEKQYVRAAETRQGFSNLPKTVQVSMTKHRYCKDEINKAFALAREQIKQRQALLRSFKRKE